MRGPGREPGDGAHEEFRPVVPARRNERVVALQVDAELGSFELAGPRIRADRRHEFARARLARGAERPCRRVVSLSGALHAGLKATDLAAALGRAVRSSANSLPERAGSRLEHYACGPSPGGRHRRSSQRLEFVRVGGARLERLLDLARGALDRVDRFIQRLHARLEQRRRVRRRRCSRRERESKSGRIAVSPVR